MALSQEFEALAWRMGIAPVSLAGDVLGNFVREQRANERAKRHLRIATDVADIPPWVASAIVTTMAWLNAETQRLHWERDTPVLRVM